MTDENSPQTLPEPEEHGPERAYSTVWRPEYPAFARTLCEQGATDQEVADALRISRRTLYYWLAQRPEFRAAMRGGNDVATERVERAYYQRACGYDIAIEKCFQYQGAPVKVSTSEHIPADTSAAYNWLCNKAADRWRNRRELTGVDGGAIEVKSVIEFVDADHESGAVPSEG